MLRNQRWRLAALLWATGGLIVASSDSRAHHAETPTGDTDRRIAFYAAKLAKDANLYPVHAQLGRAYLDKAIETFDPAYIVKARASLDESLRIQANLDAYIGHLAVANYVHRFEEALKWGRLARETAADDTSVVAKVVEARLGLGQVDDATALLEDSRLPPEDFFLAASRGHTLSARGLHGDAAGAFVRAAGFARAENVAVLTGWGYVRAAAALIHAGRLDEAAQRLDDAAQASKSTVDLLLHRGRLLEIREQWPEALAAYDAALKLSADPTIHARIALVALKMGDSQRTKEHFGIAERAFRRVLQAGEIYSLGALARLYLDADTNLAEALELAKRNYTFVRDAESRTTLEAIEARIRSAH